MKKILVDIPVGPTPFTKPEQPPEYYDTVYTNSISYNSAYTQSAYWPLWASIGLMIGFMASRKKQAEVFKILDLGCGPGQFAEFINASFNRIDYTGIDFSTAAITIAQKRIAAKSSLRHLRQNDFTFIKSEINSIDYEKIPIDIITILETLEHIEKDIEIIEKIPAGTHVIFSVPSFNDKAHVRFFATQGQVHTRYAGLFDPFAVTKFDSWFIGAGTKI